MKVFKIKVSLDTGFATCVHEGELEVEVKDDATPEEIEQEKELALKEWGYGLLDMWFEDITE